MDPLHPTSETAVSYRDSCIVHGVSVDVNEKPGRPSAT